MPSTDIEHPSSVMVAPRHARDLDNLIETINEWGIDYQSAYYRKRFPRFVLPHCSPAALDEIKRYGKVLAVAPEFEFKHDTSEEVTPRCTYVTLFPGVTVEDE